MQEQDQQQNQVIYRIVGFVLNAKDFGRCQRLIGQLVVVRPDQFELEDALDQDNGLGVGNQCDPEGFRGTWQRQGAPQKDHDGQGQRDKTGIDHLKTGSK